MTKNSFEAEVTFKLIFCMLTGAIINAMTNIVLYIFDF